MEASTVGPQGHEEVFGLPRKLLDAAGNAAPLLAQTMQLETCNLLIMVMGGRRGDGTCAKGAVGPVLAAGMERVAAAVRGMGGGVCSVLCVPWVAQLTLKLFAHTIASCLHE